MDAEVAARRGLTFRPIVLIQAMAWTVLTASVAFGQPRGAATEPGLVEKLLPYVMGLLVLAVIGVGVYMFLKNRHKKPWENFYSEPEAQGSKYEQLLAEIQGLSLRVQGGESKGYYRKIEVLLRVYLERIGCEGARQMDEDELETLLKSSTVPHGQGEAIQSIFERARVGAQNESSKLDFTAAELLKDIKKLILEVDDHPQTKHPTQSN
jgi:hypothetical protein